MGVRKISYKIKIFSILFLGIFFILGSNLETMGSIEGTITNSSGVAISNATVKVNGGDVQTDAKGHYKISELSEGTVIVTVRHSDYLPNYKKVQIKSGQTTALDIKIFGAQTTQNFNSLSGATVLANGGIVSLPPNGYVDKSGNPYSGDIIVKMSYYPITTQNGRAAFPTPFEGRDATNTPVPIESYGFMNVELTDPNGNPLDLADGILAFISYPVDTSLPQTPATIPLWYYDPQLGYWVQDGTATLSNGRYYGPVSHFTIWNLDAPGEPANLNGCAMYVTGEPVKGATIGFESDNWTDVSGPTPADGTFSFIRVMAGRDLTLFGYIYLNGDYYYGTYPNPLNLDPFSTTRLEECIVLTKQPDAPNNFTVVGKVVDQNNDPVVGASIDLGSGYYHGATTSGTSDENGQFSIVGNSNGVKLTRYIDISKNNMGWTSRMITIQQNQTTYDLGTIVLEDYYFYGDDNPPSDGDDNSPVIVIEDTVVLNGLMWEDTPHTRGDNPVTWQEGADYCANLGLGDFHDWRVPESFGELADLREGALDVDGDIWTQESGKAVDPESRTIIEPFVLIKHGDTIASWSNTEVGDGSSHMGVIFTYDVNNIDGFANTEVMNIRCVRDIEPSTSLEK